MGWRIFNWTRDRQTLASGAIRGTTSAAAQPGFVEWTFFSRGSSERYSRLIGSFPPRENHIFSFPGKIKDILTKSIPFLLGLKEIFAKGKTGQPISSRDSRPSARTPIGGW
jgi:hypothetical protein